MRTRDTDLAFSKDAALAGGLRTALKDAGFTEDPLGDDAPPATHYRLGEEGGAFYAEFLTPLYGSGVKRNGAPDATVSKAGVTAQKVRYLDLLLVSPWSVQVGPKVGVPVAADVDLLGEPDELYRPEVAHPFQSSSRREGAGHSLHPRHAGAVRCLAG